MAAAFEPEYAALPGKPELYAKLPLGALSLAILVFRFPNIRGNVPREGVL